MAKYQAPEGYVLDPNTGLYYTQVIAEDDNGAKSQVVTWFNADTGEYRQDVYPIEGSVVQASESVTSGLKPAPPEPELKITPIKGRAWFVNQVQHFLNKLQPVFSTPSTFLVYC